jgi:hypothetical protein
MKLFRVGSIDSKGTQIQKRISGKYQTVDHRKTKKAALAQVKELNKHPKA